MRRILTVASVLFFVPCALSNAQTIILPGSPTITNHALGGTATQSTTAYSRGPQNAVDGFLGEPGTHTSGTATDPWWQVVFNAGDQDIAQIVLYNRTNCCQERLRDITVRIRDAADTTDRFVSPVLNPDNVLAGPATLEWDVMAANGGSTVSGGIVRVERASDPDSTADDANVLTLNEVQAFANDYFPGVLVRDNNLALGQPVTQSTTAYGGVPERAVDGNTDGIWGNNSVTHTAGTEENPWWQVDLGGMSLIDGISIYNRDDCCGDRLSDIVVDILDSDGSTVLATSGLLNPGNAMYGPPILAVDLTTQGVSGRFVRITRMTAVGGFLSLAEVEVYGVPEPATLVLLALAFCGWLVIRGHRPR
ncbi:MAG: discoidin domain-containing protein [Pirellulales bacterium]|nr:discoidin domain-containing protein [Pirellulales bacterium]